jgi:riboflavin synthase
VIALAATLVSGHVDAPGEVIRLEALPQSWLLEMRWLEPRFGRYVCEKASIAVDGISLTVADCCPEGVTFSLAVIPHTWQETTLRALAVGDRVNLEVDQIARYAERLLLDSPKDAYSKPVADLSVDWLASNGWS